MQLHRMSRGVKSIIAGVLLATAVALGGFLLSQATAAASSTSDSTLRQNCSSDGAVEHSDYWHTSILLDDCVRLLKLKDDLRGTATLNWATDIAIEEWDGVSLKHGGAKYGAIVRLDLSNKGLNGFIPKELGDLSQPRDVLRFLDLSNNRLTGSIPKELNKHDRLETLDLSHNQLTGSIPKELGSMGRVGWLQYLYLNDNSLSGSIPKELAMSEQGQHSAFYKLHLQNNNLSGCIPRELLSLYSISSPSASELPEHLGLSYCPAPPSPPTPTPTPTPPVISKKEAKQGCKSQGAVSDAANNAGLVGDCVVLLRAKDKLRGGGALNWAVDVSMSRWDGVTLAGSPLRVTRLALTERGLNGTIPNQLSQLSDLTYLDLEGNGLSGKIPRQLSKLSKLESLVLSDNKLSGKIPAGLGSLSEVKELDISVNYLSGSIPTGLGNLSKLEHLDLDDNTLRGKIPAELGSLSKLETLWLNGNRLGGSIPSELGNLSNLEQLDLADNKLSGSVPSELGNLSNLEILWLNGNKLKGCLPRALLETPEVLKDDGLPWCAE